jgi:hypothetical protein
MVTSSHEARHRLFQEDPGVFARTFTRLGIPFPEPIAATLLSTDLTETTPLERRVDTLLEIDAADGSTYLLAVESQGRKDPDKHGSWAYYAAYLYAKYRKPPLLLVVCQDQATADWADEPFHIGLPYWRTLTVNPLVLGPNKVPVITDPSEAAKDVPLAAFAAITHSKSPQADSILRAVHPALKTVDPETRVIFAELIEQGLGTTPAARIWKDIMAVDLSFFRSETSQRLRAESRAEGRAEGRVEGQAQGQAEGRAEGQAEGRAESVLLVLRTRGLVLSDVVRERVIGCADPEVLLGWLGRAVTVDRAEAIFGEE